MSVDVWTETNTVRGHEVTPDGRASVPALCMYLQEAAGHHAHALGVSIQRLQEEGKAWVLAHLHVDIDRYPRWEDDLVIKTWPSGLDGLYATREFILRTPDDETLAKATSAWLVFDVESRRPSRPPRRVYDLEPPARPNGLPHDWNDLPLPDETDHERAFEVRYHDLDVNHHANNLRLLEWVLETLPVEHLETHRCTAVALQFKAETTLGDSVKARAQVEDDRTGRHVRHALEHAGDGRTLVRATSEWEPAQ